MLFRSPDDKIEVPGIGDRGPRSLSRQALAAVIEPRVEELFSLVQQVIRESGYEELLSSGVTIHEFTGGLLHAKTLTVDGTTSVVTSANLDRRSFEINFEMGVLVYDAGFAGTLRVLQQGYMDRSAPVDAATWAQRPLGRRLLEGAAGLLSPLL